MIDLMVVKFVAFLRKDAAASGVRIRFNKSFVS
jgi:hypothetical protein